MRQEVLSGDKFKEFLSNQFAALKNPKLKQAENHSDLTKNSKVAVTIRSIYTPIGGRKSLPEDFGPCLQRSAKGLSEVRIEGGRKTKGEQAGGLRGGAVDRYADLTLGHGSYAQVKEAVHTPTGCSVALKVYEKCALSDPLSRTSLGKEISVLEKLSHPNIVKIYDCIDSGKVVVIVEELVQGVILEDYLGNAEGGKLDEAEARKIFRQIVSAVQYCHSKGIAHRDLKLENLMVTREGEVKVIDFGLSALGREGKIRTFSGTPAYMAPEVIARAEFEGPPTDVWALGVVFYRLLTGRFPFASSAGSELYRLIAKGSYAVPKHISGEAQKLLAGMLRVDAKKRITSHQLMKSLK